MTLKEIEDLQFFQYQTAEEYKKMEMSEYFASKRVVLENANGNFHTEQIGNSCTVMSFFVYIKYYLSLHHNLYHKMKLAMKSIILHEYRSNQVYIDKFYHPFIFHTILDGRIIEKRILSSLNKNRIDQLWAFSLDLNFFGISENRWIFIF